MFDVRRVLFAGLRDVDVTGEIQAYINPLNFHLEGMLWSGDFVAKGEKGDCVAL